MNVPAEEAGTPRLLQMLEQKLDRLLRMDTRYPAVLSELAGTTLAVELLDLDRTILVEVTGSGLRLRRGAEAAGDVKIRGTLPSLISFASARDGRRSARLELHGDVAAAQELQVILAGLDLDWEEALSRWTGDIAARKVANLARGAARHARDIFRSYALDASEYLRFENRLLPLRFEVEELSAAAETLRDDTERLRARIERAAQRVQRSHRSC